MGNYVAGEIVKLMVKKDIQVKGANALMLGMTFKENCPDIRNTKAVDVYNELKTYYLNVDIYDPWASKEEVKHEYGLEVFNEVPAKKYNAIILTVAHDEFKELDLGLLKNGKAIIYDVKGFYDKNLVDARL